VSSKDVAFTYELASSDQCRSAPLCVGTRFERIETPDDRTVVFVLNEPDPGVANDLLPKVPIEREATIIAAYDLFAKKAAQADRPAIERLVPAMNTAADNESDALCERDLAKAERLLREAGAIIPDRGEFTPGDALETCSYAGTLAYQLERVIASLDSNGVDSIAAAYPVLGLYLNPVGTGPWKFVSRIPGREIVLEAFDDYHLGRPKIDRVHVVAIADDPAVLQRFTAGTLDWWPGARGELGTQLRSLDKVKVFDYPILADVALQYNLRDGRLFSDRNLRRALELCIDKKSSVDTATNGAALVATSVIPPPSWAHKDEPIVDRNVAEARRLIESSGWRMGADLVYARDGERLEAPVVVRKPNPVSGPFSVVNFLDLIRVQTADCGIDLVPYEVTLDEIVNMIDNFPHLLPGGDEPFDLYLGGRALAEDPDSPDWESSQISSPEQPHGFNFMGFGNARVDDVLAAARASANIDERARLYAEFQDIVYEERAMLFAYSRVDNTVLSERVMTGDRPLASESWWWQLETLEVAGQP
jgi:ABC-type transport system substrate-binding protein